MPHLPHVLKIVAAAGLLAACSGEQPEPQDTSLPPEADRVNVTSAPQPLSASECTVIASELAPDNRRSVTGCSFANGKVTLELGDEGPVELPATSVIENQAVVFDRDTNLVAGQFDQEAEVWRGVNAIVFHPNLEAQKLCPTIQAQVPGGDANSIFVNTADLEQRYAVTFPIGGGDPYVTSGLLEQVSLNNPENRVLILRQREPETGIAKLAFEPC